jgi:predicted GNAT family N-acyltransferase
MSFQTKVFTILPNDARFIREQVFVKEQGFKVELDEIDNRAIHFVLYKEEQAVATCRVFLEDNSRDYVLGRLAVLKEYRGSHLGERMLKEAEKYLKSIQASSIRLHAQCRVSAFYQKQGYVSYGIIENDEGVPHIWMKKNIE